MEKIVDKNNTYHAKDRKDWRKWLAKNHAGVTSIWLIYYKKESGKTRLPYADAVEEALCYGWIDSTTKTIDEERYMQLFTPRKNKSGWSKVNKERIERMIEQGLMEPAGQARIDAAKKDGSWTSQDDVEAFVIPAELQVAFGKSKAAQKYFDTLSSSLRKMILFYINAAKREETKAKRIDEMMAALKEGRVPDRYVVTHRNSKG